ncbi:hypothetical protein [Spirosoma pulveris]
MVTGITTSSSSPIHFCGVYLTAQNNGVSRKSDCHEVSGTWPLAYILYGGINIGKIMGIAQAFY